MTGKRKSAEAGGRADRSKADLGQKEAQLEKTQAELERASEAQLSHMEGGKAAGQQKAKIRTQITPSPRETEIGRKGRRPKPTP
jgi:hypothetical protein